MSWMLVDIPIVKTIDPFWKSSSRETWNYNLYLRTRRDYRTSLVTSVGSIKEGFGTVP